jgi:hypothetical protein
MKPQMKTDKHRLRKEKSKGFLSVLYLCLSV